MVYFVSFAISLIAMILAKKEAEEKNKRYFILFIYFFIAFLAYEIPAAIRYDVGTDYMFRYVHDYNAMIKYGIEPDMELFFTQLYHFIVNKNLNFQWFFVITSFIINLNVILAIAFDKNHEYPLSISIYFLNCIYFSSLSNIRQYVGISIALLSFSILLNFKRNTKNIILSLLLLMFACLCHISCYIYIFLYLFFLLKPRGRTLSIILLILLAMTPALTRIGISFIKYTKYSYFLTNYIEYGHGLAQIAFIMPEIFMFIITFSLIFFTNGGRKDQHLFMTYVFNIFAFMCYIITFIIKSNELFLRLYHIFYAFHIILVPFFLHHFIEKKEIYISQDFLKKAANNKAVINQLILFIYQNNTFIGDNLLAVNMKYIKIKTLENRNEAYYTIKVCLYILMLAMYWMQEIYVPIYGAFPYQTIFSN